MALTDKLSNIADAIRTKTDTTGKMTLTEMPGKILGIQTSEDLDTELTEQQQLISELKTTLETKAAGVTINNQDKTITENGTYTADSGYTGLGTVTVDVASGGAVETCTVDFDDGGSWISVCYATISNNQINVKIVDNPDYLTSFNIQGVIKGSNIWVEVTDGDEWECTNATLEEKLENSAFGTSRCSFKILDNASIYA